MQVRRLANRAERIPAGSATKSTDLAKILAIGDSRRRRAARFYRSPPEAAYELRVRQLRSDRGFSSGSWSTV